MNITVTSRSCASNSASSGRRGAEDLVDDGRRVVALQTFPLLRFLLQLLADARLLDRDGRIVGERGEARRDPRP